MQSITNERGLSGLAGCLGAARSRPCLLCGTSGNGVFMRCAERCGEVQPLLVIARGARNELALVPVLWDGMGEVGCPELGRLALVRPRQLLAADAGTEEVVQGVGGQVWFASGFEDHFVKGVIRGAAMMIAWDVAGVYPAVDGCVLREIPRPQRTLVDPEAPRYGRWPAPWLPRVSLSEVIPGSEGPFLQRVRSGAAGLPEEAFGAVGLPRVRADFHPVAKALALAALLRSVPWKGGGKTLGARLLPPQGPVAAYVGICQGQVYRRDHDGQWERLFIAGKDDRTVGLREVELAEGHMRMADALAGNTAGAGKEVRQ